MGKKLEVPVEDIKFHVHDTYRLVFVFNCPRCHAKVVMSLYDSGFDQCDCVAHWAVGVHASLLYDE